VSHAALFHTHLTHADLVALRRIYFSDRLYSEEELPPEFKLFLPIQVRMFSGGRGSFSVCFFTESADP
jgi:hypothetical protein